MNRQITIDAVRGFAVLGILAMNIVSLGLPSGAHGDPTQGGGAAGADLWAWALGYLFVDGKMRALFTLLFGASMLLIADRAEAAGQGPAAVHYRRMVWLFAIGMLHAWLIWYGDILVTYAIAGAIVFPARRLRPHQQFAIGAIILAMMAILSFAVWAWFGQQALLAGGGAAAQHAVMAAAPAEAAAEIAGYRGGFAEVWRTRAPMTLSFQTELLLTVSLWEAMGLMLIGMALFCKGFFSGEWSRAAYWRMACAAPLGIALGLPMLRALITSRWSPMLLALDEAVRGALVPLTALGYAAAVILLARSGAASGLVARLVACGRMALSNYLGASILLTTLFYGYGFGRFGHYGRAELHGIVAAVWTLQLWASPLWLRRFHHGPAEWLWRSLARGRRQPMRRSVA